MKPETRIVKTYKHYVLDMVKLICPFKKKSKYTYEYYYDMILIVLKDVVSWRSLKITAKYVNKKENHYTTIRKMFNKWCNKDIFKVAYEKMLKEEVIKKYDKKEINLFIDSTFIDNKTGSELVGINPFNYKKRVSKLSILCDDKKNIINVKAFKSTLNDCKTIEETIKSLDIKGKINLVGDKGYLVREDVKKRLRKKKIRLIVPRKKNQKKKRIRKKDRELLKERNKVENAIKLIKSINIISLRKDKNILTYMGFVWIGCGIRLDNNKIG